MKQAMIFAAGLGTRLRPLTNHCPKALIPLGGIPLIGHVLNRLTNFQRVVVNIHYLGEQIRSYLAQRQDPFELLISDERDLLLDTGGGLQAALSLFDPTSPILIHNADIFTNLDADALYRYHQEHPALATLATRQRHSRRLLHFNQDLALLGRWSDQCPAEDLALGYSGIAVLEPHWIQSWQGFPPVFSLTEALLNDCSKHRIQAYRHDQDQWWDVGTIETYQALQALMKH